MALNGEVNTSSCAVCALTIQGSMLAWTHLPDAPDLIDRHGMPTRQVHCYSEQFVPALHPDYAPMVFPKPLLSHVRTAWRLGVQKFRQAVQGAGGKPKATPGPL